ncbi:phage tail sheath C-terminal domain-containing protein [Zunongwangia sp. F260]|uniref:Phage tail sheath C-terminal domain-containing protein n=1 Tax=Autumnicola lenta TaxID=3075593 RepID=A0ABU3CNJ3_9FLAO|nr:phage tail sheath C-terminal domain-containing protein [Zunongwangia sp. F260]MDT0647928.1 phage tail sheath C-terminal domain-containing protein [Zunongwangia sp. F260]
MSKIRKTPGVYINELQNALPDIHQVETAVPAFVGYTERAGNPEASLYMKPIRISSMLEFEQLFGTDNPIDTINVKLDEHQNFAIIAIDIPNTVRYLLYDSLRLFYGNGGGDCYIVSVGLFGNAPTYGYEFASPPTGLRGGIRVLETYDEPTLILFPDAVNVTTNGNDDAGFYHLQQLALQQCESLRDRMAIFDLKENISGDHSVAISNFRSNIGSNNLEFGAAYSPYLLAPFSREISINAFSGNLKGTNGQSISLHDLSAESSHLALIANYEAASTEEDVEIAERGIYQIHSVIKNIAEQIKIKINTIPPSGAIAGVYNMVDVTRGVWKAPANVSVNSVIAPSVAIDNAQQEKMNVEPNGKSINAIRQFAGRGILVWGARTLAGNDNEWRYLNVRRLVIMVEESCKKATESFSAEPNTSTTWVRVKNLIQNFLTTLWRQGALAGAKPEDAFFVKVGLNETMTINDILQNRMNIMIGLAAVRPAEFIILRITVPMQNT